MKIVPRTKPSRVAFYEGHIERWTQHAAALGVSEEQCEELRTRVESARAALIEQEVASDAARAATSNANLAVQSMHTLGAAMIAQMKAHGQATGAPNILNIAGLPHPSDGSPLPHPSRPDDFTFALTTQGTPIVQWQCAQPSGALGTSYEVARSLVDASGNPGPFVHVGVAGSDKRFIDETLPVGCAGATYRVTGLRSGTRGPSGQAGVQFGVKMAA